VALAHRLDIASFLRLHGARAPALMWFLGAGASASAGVPTAAQMIWDFKRTIFCSEERVPLAACQYIDDPRVRNVYSGISAGVGTRQLAIPTSMPLLRDRLPR
jgi:hypothetical protein